ncbi:MAG TPA: sulfatase [Chthoniobacteraceae bacterium]|nr:sulfatase [Chthoniobacteraceae bacterium]
MTPAPNIILINCDDLGYGDLGCYGSTRNATPHLDALARGGLRLTDYYVMSPVCSASRAALLTGCYPARIGFEEYPVLFPGNPVGLDPKETTLAGLLKEGGYATKIIGKWHCGDQPGFLPTRHGFDAYFGIPYSNDMGVQSNRRDGKGTPLPLMRDETVIQEQPDQRGITERYTDEALQWINDHRQRPFFLYLAHMHVHVPLFVPKQFLEKSTNGAYGAAVAAIDWSTGMIVHRLRELGLLENTLILFTSDNGSRVRDEGGSNAPCRGTKGTTWEGGQRVPCIVHWPEKIQPGTVWNGLARSVDLLPTLSRFAGIAARPALPIDGIDLSAQFLDPTLESPNDTLAYYRRERLEAVRVGDWKLHFGKDGEPLRELYHLRDDIGETRNLYTAQPEVVARLEMVAETFRCRFGDLVTGQKGTECRPIGRVENPRKLTRLNPDYPYMIAEYDLPDMPRMCG